MNCLIENMIKFWFSLFQKVFFLTKFMLSYKAAMKIQFVYQYFVPSCFGFSIVNVDFVQNSNLTFWCGFLIVMLNYSCQLINLLYHHYITTSSQHHNISSSHHHITSSPHHLITTSSHHHITTSPHHLITSSPHHHIIFSFLLSVFHFA